MSCSPLQCCWQFSTWHGCLDLSAPAFNHTSQDVKKERILQKVGRALSASVAQGHKVGKCRSPVCTAPSQRAGWPPQAPQRHLASSKIWLSGVSMLHRQQPKGLLLPRLCRATWQQAEIPESGLSQGLHSLQGWCGYRSPALTLLQALT